MEKCGTKYYIITILHQAKKMNRKTVCMRVDGEVWKEVKKAAVDRDMPIGRYVEITLLRSLRILDIRTAEAVAPPKELRSEK